MTLVQEALSRPLPIRFSAFTPPATPSAPKEIVEPTVKNYPPPKAEKTAGNPAKDFSDDIAWFKAKALENLKKRMMDPQIPLAERISAARDLGYTIKFKGAENDPRQVILRHPESRDRIQFTP